MNIIKDKPTLPKRADIREIGAPIDGEPQYSDRRLFFQLHVFSDCPNTLAIIELLENSSLNTVLYDDLSHPTGIGLLSMGEDPAELMEETQLLLQNIQDNLLENIFSELKLRPEMTMTGRTYSSGREPNLEQWLINKPQETVLNPENTWGIWYPLRRKPEFYNLDPRERGRILAEHAMLGRSYAAAGYASDIRLACFGLDKNDNEFVIGLVGSELYPLSKLIQDMRQTEQTTRYIESLGPFFVGKVRKQFTKQ